MSFLGYSGFRVTNLLPFTLIVTTKRTKDTKDSEIIIFQFSYFVLFATFVVNCLFRFWLRCAVPFVLNAVFTLFLLADHAPASTAVTALRKEADERIIIFSASTTRKKIRPPRKRRGQTQSGIASLSNKTCSGGA